MHENASRGLTMNEKPFSERFYINMRRVGAVIGLIHSGNATIVNDGLRGDLGRVLVVFLHATFEDVLRTAARQRVVGRKLKRNTFGAWGDVTKVLHQMGLDLTPFKSFCPALRQLMMRRHSIVHEADLPTPTKGACPPWSIADDFLVTMWMLSVMAFHAQLCVSIDPSNEVERWSLARLTKAFSAARQIGGHLLAVAKCPGESRVPEMQSACDMCMELTGYLGKPSSDDILAMWEKMKPPDDDTREEELLASIRRMTG
jgi:hypothetical protein